MLLVKYHATVKMGKKALEMSVMPSESDLSKSKQ